MISEERKSRLLNEMEKLNAYHEIQNLMARATAAWNFQEKDKVLSFLALDSEDAAVEIADEGLYEGRDAILHLAAKMLRRKKEPGIMQDVQLTTPMIVVADDVNTAKAVWWMPGAGTIHPTDDSLLDDEGIRNVVEEERRKANNGAEHASDPLPVWLWGSISVDFIREADVWKIWHLHYFRLIKCSYYEGWVNDTSMENKNNSPLDSYAKPSTYHNPYTPQSIRDGIPAMPLAYDTWKKEDRFWELNKDKTGWRR